MFERDTKGDLHWVMYDHDDDEFIVDEEPSKVTVLEIAHRATERLAVEAADLQLYARSLCTVIKNSEFPPCDIDRLASKLSDRTFHLANQLRRMADDLERETGGASPDLPQRFASAVTTIERDNPEAAAMFVKAMEMLGSTAVQQ